jgi:hypothetical protein
MRCYCCNKNLNDYESSLKGTESGQYLDMCLSCLNGSGINYQGNENFNPFEELNDDESGDDEKEY